MGGAAHKIMKRAKGAVNRMLHKDTIENIFHICVKTSPDMLDAISLWGAMYRDQSPWLNDEVLSLGLPSAISAEIAQMVTLELSVTIQGGERGKIIERAMADVVDKMRELVEYAAAVGTIIIKPYVSNGVIGMDYVRADQFLITDYTTNGEITGAVFSEMKTHNGYQYTRFDYRCVTDKGLEIQNVVYRKRIGALGGYGVPAELTEISEWAQLPPKVILQGVDSLLIGVLRPPQANNIDMDSPLGISGFARATTLIKEADKQFSRLLWEFESGERALYVSPVAFTVDPETKERTIPNKRLYRQLKVTKDAEMGAFFEDWTPDIREQSILNGLNDILGRVEDACSLARGTISTSHIAALKSEVTATQVKVSKQRTFATVSGWQKSVRAALTDVIDAIYVWLGVAGVSSPSNYEVVFDFDDSVISDRDSQFAQYMQLLTAQIITAEEMRAWYFDIPLEQAAKELADLKPSKLFEDE